MSVNKTELLFVSLLIGIVIGIFIVLGFNEITKPEPHQHHSWTLELPPDKDSISGNNVVYSYDNPQKFFEEMKCPSGYNLFQNSQGEFKTTYHCTLDMVESDCLDGETYNERKQLCIDYDNLDLSCFGLPSFLDSYCHRDFLLSHNFEVDYSNDKSPTDTRYTKAHLENLMYDILDNKWDGSIHVTNNCMIELNYNTDDGLLDVPSMDSWCEIDDEITLKWLDDAYNNYERKLIESNGNEN